MRCAISTPLIILLALGNYTRLVAGLHLSLRQPEDLEDPFYFDKNAFRDFQYSSLRKLEDERLEEAIKALNKILILPWPNGESPLVYIENPRKEIDIPESIDVAEEEINENQFNPVPSKRMRYYRKYPWKRENTGYNPENPFVCYPSKSEIHRLLVALHETRYTGFKNPPVDFCNRKRPAHTIMTNMHFGGK